MNTGHIGKSLDEIDGAPQPPVSGGSFETDPIYTIKSVASSNKHAYLAMGTAFLIALVPRIVRFLHPFAWFEDAGVIYHAFAITQGQVPFIDGIYSHPPLPEACLGAVFLLTGPSYVVAEIISACAMVFTVFVLYLTCRGIYGIWASLFGVVLLSTSSLFIRYHIFERETFTAAVTVLALWLVTSFRPECRWFVPILGLLPVIAAAIKLSGALLLPPLVFAYIIKGQRQIALRILRWGIAGGAVLALGLFLGFGRAAWFQLFLLQTIAGQRVPAWDKFQNIIIPGLNLLLLFGTAGILLGLNRRAPVAALLAGLLLLQTLGFMLFKGTIWQHNLIDLAPLMAMGSIIALNEICSWFHGRFQLIRFIIIIIPMLILLLLGAAKWKNISSGWGYVKREEVAGAAAFLQKNTGSQSRISAPHYLACEAGRLKFVDYRELTGPYLWMLQTLKDEGVSGLGKYRDFGPWMQMISKTYPLWRPAINRAVRERRLSAVVWDRACPEWALQVQADIAHEKSEGLFSSSGYKLAYQHGPYAILLPNE